ncbi:MAG: FAD-dependent oxidoreductase [Candidatus Hodarchaeota archaeon]
MGNNSDKKIYVEDKKEIPIVREYDVIVVGGSQSGVAAAICAAREGAKVLIVERNCFLGGQSVGTMVVQWEKRAFINNLGAVATRGIAKEMLDRIIALGGSDKLWEDPPGCEEMRDGEEWLDAEAVKIVLLRMCLEEKVDLLFDTLCVGAMMDKASSNPKVNGIIIENKSGRQALSAKVVIDASAYLDIVWFAMGEEGVIIREPMQRMGPGWQTLYGGVDSEKFVDYIINNRVCSGYPSLLNPEKVRKHLETGRLISLRGYANVLDKAYDEGMLDDWPEERMGMPIGIGTNWWGKDRWASSIGHFRIQDALDAWALSQAEIDRQYVAWKYLEILRMIPGWENAYIARSSVRLGLRETRILKAVTMLTRKDIFEPDHERKDAVGRSGAHDPGKNRLWKAYPIPYGIIVPETLDGVLCCSRTIGAADKTALDAHRGITPTIVVGQAAGTAAALAVKNKVEPRNVDVQELREILRKNDVVLDAETVELDTIPDRYRK